MHPHCYYWNDHSYIFWFILRVYIATIIGYLPLTLLLALIWVQLVNGSVPTIIAPTITSTTTNSVISNETTTFVYSLAGCAVYSILLSRFWNNNENYTNGSAYNRIFRNNTAFVTQLPSNSDEISTPIVLPKYQLKAYHVVVQTNRRDSMFNDFECSENEGKKIESSSEFASRQDLSVSGNRSMFLRNASDYFISLYEKGFDRYDLQNITIEEVNSSVNYEACPTHQEHVFRHKTKMFLPCILLQTSNRLHSCYAINQSWISHEIYGDPVCPICFEDYCQDEMISYGSFCGHSFHSMCIQRWINKSSNIHHPSGNEMIGRRRKAYRTCPCCRQELSLQNSA